MTSENIPVLYIAGSGRSGSTLIESILGQIEDFVPVGELKNIWLRNLESGDLCGCGKPVQDCEFWLNVFNNAFGGLEEVDFREMRYLRNRVDRERYLPNILFNSLKSEKFKQEYLEYISVYKKLYSAVFQVSGNKIIIDSSKDISLLALISQIPTLNVNVLHLIRDSRGVAYSWANRSKFKPEITSRNAYLTREQPIRMAIDWKVRNIFIENFRNYVNSYLKLYYEEFIRFPVESLNQQMEVLGISNNLEFISTPEVELNKVHHTIAGNPIRFQKGTIKLQLDEEWRSKMKPVDRSMVTLVTWFLLKRYHYIP